MSEEEFIRQFFAVARQAMSDAKKVGVGWIRFTEIEDGKMEVTSVHPNEVHPTRTIETE